MKELTVAPVTVATLDILTGTQRGQSLVVIGPKFLIGRAPQCQLRLVSEAVGQIHCALLLDGYTVRLRDLGTHAPTLVNGQEFANDYQLKEGDHISVGPTMLRVRF